MNPSVSKFLLVLLCSASGIVYGQRCFKNTVNLNSLNLQTEVAVLNFPAAKGQNAASMVISNESSGTAITSTSGKGIWIGKNSLLSNQSDVSIAFSKPVNSFEFNISSINNDATGEEEVQGFSVFNEKGEDVSAEANFIWHTGPQSQVAQSRKDATFFDPTTRTIKPGKEVCCEFASGRMEIVSVNAFSKVFFRHKEIRMKPNGILLEGEIVFCVKEQKVVKNQVKKSAEKKAIPVATTNKKTDAAYNTGTTIELHNVSFAQGEAELLAESFSELDKLVRAMKENVRMQIEVRGHTDNIGNPTDNLILSQERAAAVKKYLVRKGIAEKRIVEKGFGGSKPLVESGTDAERQKNRRVEIFIKRN